MYTLLIQKISNRQIYGLTFSKIKEWIDLHIQKQIFRKIVGNKLNEIYIEYVYLT